jgi:hypothetical protein
MRWFYRWYGSNPLHLLTLIASFALAGYAAEKLLARDMVAILVWFAGAVIGHDLLLMPLYTLADRSVLAVFRHERRPDPPTVSWINYLRVPAVLSGLLLLIWFPLIFRLPNRFTILTGLSLDPYLMHWLAVTGALFLLSAVALAVRLGTRPWARPADLDPGEAAEATEAYGPEGLVRRPFDQPPSGYQEPPAPWGPSQAPWEPDPAGFGQGQGGWERTQAGWERTQDGWGRDQSGWGSSHGGGGQDRGGWDQDRRDGWGQSQGGYERDQGGWSQDQGGYERDQGGWSQDQGGWDQREGRWGRDESGWGQDQGRQWAQDQDRWAQDQARLNRQSPPPDQPWPPRRPPGRHRT